MALHVTVAVGRDLQDPVAVAHGVVVADDAFLLDGKNVGEIAAGIGNEGGCGFGRRQAEPAIMLGDEAFLEEAIGRRHGGDPGEPQLLWQLALQGAKHPLGAAARFRRVGWDELDAELDERTMDLGGMLAIDLAASPRPPPAACSSSRCSCAGSRAPAASRGSASP